MSDVSQSYSTHTVSSYQLHIFLFKTIKLQKPSLYQGIKIWNSTSSNIKLLSYPKFKPVCKQMLFND